MLPPRHTRVRRMVRPIRQQRVVVGMVRLRMVAENTTRRLRLNLDTFGIRSVGTEQFRRFAFRTKPQPGFIATALSATLTMYGVLVMNSGSDPASIGRRLFGPLDPMGRQCVRKSTETQHNEDLHHVDLDSRRCKGTREVRRNPQGT